MKTPTLHSVLIQSALVVLLGGLYFAPTVRGQLSSGSIHAAPLPKPSVESWPPHPKNIVLLDDRIQGDPGLIAGFGMYMPYSVPLNRWLVVTEITTLGSTAFSLNEDLGGVLTYRASESASIPAAPMGLVFAPGASVVIKNETNQPKDGQYRVHGYLVPIK